MGKPLGVYFFSRPQLQLQKSLLDLSYHYNIKQATHMRKTFYSFAIAYLYLSYQLFSFPVKK